MCKAWVGLYEEFASYYHPVSTYAGKLLKKTLRLEEDLKYPLKREGYRALPCNPKHTLTPGT
jgi:hypothetical protein